MRPKVRREVGLDERLSDNAFGLLLPKVEWSELRQAVIRQVKAEWGRGRLRPVELPWSTVAIDGKHLATVPEKRLRGLITQRTDLDGQALSAEELRRVLSTQFPYVQLQDGQQGLVGLVRVHRATLVSADAAVVVDQWPIRGETNELATIEVSLQALFSAYGRTKMVEMVTLDAGNARPEIAARLRARDVHYFVAVKRPQGALHRRAVDRLAGLAGHKAGLCTTVEARGKTICYTVWTHQLDEELGWKGARQLVRVERVVAGEDGEVTVGNRYFVTSVDADQMQAEHALELAKAHWRCENEGHWTADAIWEEDARRTPWTQHPDGVLVVGLMRMIAINILAVLRALSRYRRGQRWETPTWETVTEQALQMLFEPLLDMTAFNALEV